jgi:hypothetical protein
MIQISSDLKYDNVLEKFGTELGAHMPKLVMREMRLLLEMIIDWTPPRNKAQGVNKIRGEVAGNRTGTPLFFPMQQYMLLTNKEMRASGGSNYIPLWTGQGGATGVNRENYWAGKSVDELISYHNSKRNKQGRLRGLSGGIFKKGAEHGWTEIVRPAVPVATTKKELNEMTRRVGRLKASFGKALSLVGGDSSKIPAWVRRHVPSNPFGHLVEMDLRQDDSEVCIMSDAPSVVRNCEDSGLIRRAVSARVKKMNYEFKLFVKGKKDKLLLR